MRKRVSECILTCSCFSHLTMDSEISSPLESMVVSCPPHQNAPQEDPKIDISGASTRPPPSLSPESIISYPRGFDGLDIEQDDGSPCITTKGKGLMTYDMAKAGGNARELSEIQDRRAVPNQTAGVAGVLYKWVNFGKGWRPRWFVLQGGVLSYYKVHGPHKITLSHERHKSLQIIGEESQKRLMKKQRNFQRQSKSFGEVHLQVSFIRKSKSDDKRFYIHTGTKTLHLRTENKEDRAAWLEELKAAKKNFLQSTSPQALLPLHNKVVVSTERLRARLLEEGVIEDVIRDCEAIMQAEFSMLEEHLGLLEQQHIYILRRLRQLEAEKLELETTVMDESQSQAHEGTASSGQEQVESETESEDFQENQSGVEADTDEEDAVFFDTKEFLSVEAFGHSPSISRKTSAESLGPLLRSDFRRGDFAKHANGVYSGMELVGFDYPPKERRKRLPEPKQKEESVSLWSMIKNNIGKDLTKTCLPVYFNEPLSSLQKCFEDLEYSYLLDQAYEWGKRGNGLMRILNVAAFAVSGYSSTGGRTCKPFNPLLGETYEADYPDKGLRFFSEKVSHHPMVLACHCEGRGWVLWGDCNLKSKFWGRSIQLYPVGILSLKFADGEMFQWSKVTTSISNLIIGRLHCDHYGTMRIQGTNELLCKLNFKEHSILERNPHQVQGFVHDKSGNKLATLFGKWDESVYFVPGDLATKPKGYEPMSEAVLLWRCNERPKLPTRYNFTAFAITLNELTPGLKEILPPTDSRLRPDQRHLENGEYDLANVGKLRLEEKQRQARNLQERGWQPRWFRKSKNSDTFEYIGGYWEARENGKWDACVDIFGSTIPVDSFG